MQRDDQGEYEDKFLGGQHADKWLLELFSFWKTFASVFRKKNANFSKKMVGYFYHLGWTFRFVEFLQKYLVNFEFQLETQLLRTTARLKSFNLFGIFRVKTLTTLPTPVENERR